MFKLDHTFKWKIHSISILLLTILLSNHFVIDSNKGPEFYNGENHQRPYLTKTFLSIKICLFNFYSPLTQAAAKKNIRGLYVNLNSLYPKEMSLLSKFAPIEIMFTNY